MFKSHLNRLFKLTLCKRWLNLQTNQFWFIDSLAKKLIDIDSSCFSSSSRLMNVNQWLNIRWVQMQTEYPSMMTPSSTVSKIFLTTSLKRRSKQNWNCSRKNKAGGKKQPEMILLCTQSFGFGAGAWHTTIKGGINIVYPHTFQFIH